ncbi:Hypothetical predicted protein [Cloeon dipterum]|uniref:Uncharacterized protein n=1 Tax=Cloeon dipterum TaxID=197152 RepID=A0A8S1DIB7_9INSE|nr:Hypothetical predicted protein [Cloeon dipterum]
MSYQKALCLICELPTADGAVLAVHVDKEKLQEWFLNVGGHELAEDVDDDDLICYFCVWHAEFLWKFNGMSDESLVWWPRNSDYLDDAAKELRMYYFEGKLEQCWVPLEKVKLPKDEEDIEDSDAEIQPTTIEQAKKKCFYCAKPFQNRNISRHVKKTHKNAIRFDHAIFAVHVDKDRLENWFLNVCGYELAEDVKDEDKICYFCAWQAEFLWKFDGMEDDDLVWWPRNSDFDDAANELRKYYFEGKIEQCWVQLEEVDLTISEEDEIEKDEEELESVKQSNIRSEKKKCFYCASQIIWNIRISK